jgi:hypothetical protein
MKNTAQLTLLLVAVSWPVMAKSHNNYHRHYSHHEGSGETHSHITCEMVRAYVAQVGLAQARAMARSQGMTASEEQKARQCLVHKA